MREFFLIFQEYPVTFVAHLRDFQLILYVHIVTMATFEDALRYALQLKKSQSQVSCLHMLPAKLNVLLEVKIWLSLARSLVCVTAGIFSTL